MNLIQIQKATIGNEEINSANARDIHSFLEVKTPFHMWIKRAIEKYDFIENQDFALNKNVHGENKGQFVSTDYIVTIDMAKELSMLENNDKGKQARKYFIEAEKKSKQPMTIDQLLAYNNKVIAFIQAENLQLTRKIQEDKPKVNFANAIIGTTSNIDFETFAKALYDTEGIKMGRNKLMEWMRDNNYLTRKNKPFQFVIDRGLMTPTQELVSYTQPRITGKGQMYFTNKLLDEVQNGRA